MRAGVTDVCFTPESRHSQRRLRCLLSAKRRHWATGRSAILSLRGQGEHSAFHLFGQLEILVIRLCCPPVNAMFGEPPTVQDSHSQCHQGEHCKDKPPPAYDVKQANKTDQDQKLQQAPNGWNMSFVRVEQHVADSPSRYHNQNLNKHLLAPFSGSWPWPVLD